jgi:hypothetical protein
VPGSGSILTSGPSFPGEFAHASFQRGHAGFKVGRLSHAGSVQWVIRSLPTRSPPDSMTLVVLSGTSPQICFLAYPGYPVPVGVRRIRDLG